MLSDEEVEAITDAWDGCYRNLFAIGADGNLTIMGTCERCSGLVNHLDFNAHLDFHERKVVAMNNWRKGR